MKSQILTKDGNLKTVNLNRRKAIRLKCLDCSGFYEKEVRDCPINDCPLYPFRSGQGKQNPKKRDKAIKTYCRHICMLNQKSEVTKCLSVECPLFNFRSYSKKLSHIEGTNEREIAK